MRNRPRSYRVTWRYSHVTSHVTIESQVVISYRCSIVTKSVSSAVFDNTKHIGVTTLTFQGHVTSLVTRPYYSSYPISYRCFTVTKSVSPAVFEKLGPKHIEVKGSRPWLFWVTWRHLAISYMCSIVTKSVSPAIFEIMGTKHNYWVTILTLFSVTWRHRSRGHSTRHWLFPIGDPLEPSFCL